MEPRNMNPNPAHSISTRLRIKNNKPKGSANATYRLPALLDVNGEWTLASQLCTDGIGWLIGALGNLIKP